MDLQEGILKGILSQLPIATETNKKSEQIVVITLDQDHERTALSLATGFDQFLIGSLVQAAYPSNECVYRDSPKIGVFHLTINMETGRLIMHARSAAPRRAGCSTSTFAEMFT